MQYLKIAILCAVLLFSYGCAGKNSHSEQESKLEVRLLWQGSQCGNDRPAPHAVWIENPDQFKKNYAQLTKHSFNAKQNLLSGVDFSREGILIAKMGQQPTGGYGMDLKQGFAVLSDDTAILKISWIEPPPGSILPQVITSPCLVIILPKGPYSRIHLLDQNNRLRMRVQISQR